MKRTSIFTLLFVATLIINGCGTPPAPTMNAVDVQATAQSAAQTMVAQTQAAVPTNTPLPPTEEPTQTAVATETSLPLPTLDVTLTIAPTLAPTTSSGNSGVDPCSTRVLSPAKGKETIVRVVNMTNVPITVSMYLNETASHGECGYRGFTLSKNNDIVYHDLVQGCYNLWAWSDDPKGKFRSSGGGCINNPDKWTFEVSANNIKFVGP